MDELKRVLYGEIEDLREKGHKFLNGEITKMEFKHASGGFGVYAHNGGREFMIRLRIPSGIMKYSELQKVYEFAKKYGMDKIHFTTRQAIQFHGLSIDAVCDLMKEALDNDIYTRGAGGNFPRNVALSPLSGINTDEAFDATPYALAVGNHFLEKIYSYKLPRKLKVSFSSSIADGAHCTVQDLGFLSVKKDEKEYFQVYLGGGLGQNPKLAVKYPELIEPKEVIYHIEAMTKFFMAEGDYENKNKARVRYILDRMGEETFLNEYKKYVEKEKVVGGKDVEINATECRKNGKETNVESNRLFPQKQQGLYSVYVHPIGGQLGILDLQKIIDEINDVEDVDIRLAMTEGVYFRNLNGKEAERLLAITENITSKTMVKQSVACIGAPTCQIGQCNSQGLLRMVVDYFEEKSFNSDVLPRIYISGCGNSCGTHQIGAIGFTGKKKRIDGDVVECFTLYVGGSFAIDKAKMGQSYGDIISSKIPEFLYEIALIVKKSDMKFIDYVDNNKDEFKKIVEKYLV
ncbi:nitrite/sulfite reductase [Clostridium sp.]|uniref:nitrite/sulfite reductase n=1 Tax=Clostridium sp. TaxID=1506 RepID=UPI0032164B1A